MLELNNWQELAINKLKDQKKDVSGRKETAMAGAVYQQLIDFCNQSETFAKSVVEGGSFGDCMKAVAKDVGTSISDVDAYKKAVQFYFRSATVRVQMCIELPGAREPIQEASAEPVSDGIMLNLLDFL